MVDGVAILRQEAAVEHLHVLRMAVRDVQNGPDGAASHQHVSDGIPNSVTETVTGTAETGHIVRREGIVRPNGSPAAPTPYSLYNIYDRRMMEFLYITKDNEISLKPYSGKKVIVTGPESIDPRWQNHPLLTVKTIELRNQ